MAEQGAAEEQEETSTMGRLKNKLKDLTGQDSSDEEQAQSDSDEQAQGESGDAEASAEDDQGQEDSSGETVGGYSVDDADPTDRAENEDEARAQIRKLQKEGPPEQLADWPTGKAMFLTFGGAEGEEGYEDGHARQMGPSSTRHHPDGSVEVQGEMVDNPDDYKREESVTEEADKIGMDKGAKTEQDPQEEDGSGEEESSGDQDGAQAEGSGEEQSSEEQEGAQAEGSSDEESSGGGEATQAEGSGDGQSSGDGQGGQAESSGDQSSASGESQDGSGEGSQERESAEAS